MSPMQNDKTQVPADLQEQLASMRREVAIQEQAGQRNTCAHEILANLERAAAEQETQEDKNDKE